MRILLPLLVSTISIFVHGCTNNPPSHSDETSAGETSSSVTVVDTDDDISRIEEIIAGMTLEEKVGQLFMVRCPNTDKIKAIQDYHLGGYVLFANHFKDKTPQSIKEEISQFQSASKIPMLIGVDEEGGTVVRVSKYPAFRKTPFLSPRNLYSIGGFDLIEQDTAEKCELLLSLGINVNLAPVCDLSSNSKDYMYNRSFSGSPELTSRFVKIVVDTMNSYKVGASLKHFPGYGGNVDTHTGIAVDNREYKTFLNKDFLPFIAGIEGGAGSVMVSHNIVLCMDNEKPASLSKNVHDILRDTLKFAGVIMTDDLDMDAIRQYTGAEASAVMAIKAGNDILVSTNFKEQIPAVLRAVESGEIPLSRIEESVMRILLWKIELGLL
ncbi:MAG: beta-hexosaminidase [Clostridiales bacterium]|nr:beta-hexosaminidase [Clostridiales bacterium]